MLENAIEMFNEIHKLGIGISPHCCDGTFVLTRDLPNDGYEEITIEFDADKDCYVVSK